MGVLTSSQVRNAETGPRRLDPSSDLAPVAALIEEAFSDELDRDGREVLHELRRLGRLGPLLWLLRQMSPDFGEVLSGFVWEEDGRIVGNASLNLAGPFPAQWRISNVAVLPSYRRRGISRCLMEEAIEFVRARNGRAVSLQVRDDNVAALELYRSLGFVAMTAETELVLPAGAGSDSRGLQDSDSQFAPRPLEPEEGPDVYALVLRATPQEDQRQTPLQKIDFELDWFQAAADAWMALFTGRRTYRFVVDGRSGLAGYLTATTAPRTGGPHRLMLWVNVRYEGRVERDLLRAALKELLRHSNQPVQIKVNPVKAQTVDALLALGFLKRRTLLTMELQVD
jgi:ribosomal protein S18 acetylase RimI-like enzyme